MPSYNKWINRAKDAIIEGKSEIAENIKVRLSHTYGLWEQVLELVEQETAAAREKAKVTMEAKKAAPKKKQTKVKSNVKNTSK